MNLHTGEIAELKATIRALEKGYLVSKPVILARYDLVIDTGDRLLRAQVKRAGGSSSNATGSVIVPLRRQGNRCYCKSEVDILLVYVPQIDKVLKLDAEEFCGKPSIIIRFDPPRNKQVKGIRLAQDLYW